MFGEVAAEFLEDQTFAGRAADDGRAACSPSHNERKRAEIESGPARLAAVAVPAIGLENRHDVALEGGTGVLVRADTGASAECRGSRISRSELSVAQRVSRVPRARGSSEGGAASGPSISREDKQADGSTNLVDGTRVEIIYKGVDVGRIG